MGRPDPKARAIRGTRHHGCHLPSRRCGLRTMLYQAAMVMLNKGRPSWLTAWAWNVAKRRGKTACAYALARRIG